MKLLPQRIQTSQDSYDPISGTINVINKAFDELPSRQPNDHDLMKEVYEASVMYNVAWCRINSIMQKSQVSMFDFLNTKTIYYNGNPYEVSVGYTTDRGYSLFLAKHGVTFTGENRLEIMGKIRRFLRDRQTK